MTLTKITKVCPNHDSNFDCTPFCRICEGRQEYEPNGYLPCQRYEHCGAMVEEDIWHEELGFCLDCSNLYFDHKLNPYTLEEEEGWDD